MYMLEQVENNEWRFIESDSVANSMEEFHEALDSFNSGDLEIAEEMIRSLIIKCPEHIDAIHHLALISRYQGKAIEYYLLEKEAVEVGLSKFPKKFKIGKDLLEWGWLENRPFLRAYEGLGIAHHERESINQALDIFSNMLLLNPNDNQGIRSLAVNCYFTLNQPNKVLSICKQYSDDTLPEVLYGRPLALIQLNKLSEAEIALKNSIRILPSIAKELLKKRHTKPKSEHQGYITVGGSDQAYYYWENSGDFWKNIKGALELLKELC